MFGDNGEILDIFLGIVLKPMLVSHGTIVGATGRTLLRVAVGMESHCSTKNVDHLRVFSMKMLTTSCSRRKSRTHDADSAIVYIVAREEEALTAFEAINLGFSNFVEIDNHRCFVFLFTYCNNAKREHLLWLILKIRIIGQALQLEKHRLPSTNGRLIILRANCHDTSYQLSRYIEPTATIYRGNWHASWAAEKKQKDKGAVP